MTVATIGVYGWTLEEFLAALRDTGVRVVFDVRQRRGVRGHEYAWANSLRLQTALSKAGIGYHHHPELAPTTELRQVQYDEDARAGVGKRNRVELAPAYRERYLHELLDRVDLGELIAELPARGCRCSHVRRARSGGLPRCADRGAALRGTESRSSNCALTVTPTRRARRLAEHRRTTWRSR